MLNEEKFEELADINPEALLVDGLNEAVIGFGHQFTSAPVAIYDYYDDKCIEIFMRDAMIGTTKTQWNGCSLMSCFKGRRIHGRGAWFNSDFHD
jgi:hypothetical protein